MKGATTWYDKRNTQSRITQKTTQSPSSISASTTDIDQATALLQQTMDDLKKELDVIVGNVQVSGIQSMQTSGIILRAMAEVKANTQAGVIREAQKRIKLAFDAKNIPLFR